MISCVDDTRCCLFLQNALRVLPFVGSFVLSLMWRHGSMNDNFQLCLFSVWMKWALSFGFRYTFITHSYRLTPTSFIANKAHCLSQWGHNFRPSYLRVRSLIPLIEPKSILALTATAGPMVVRDICNTLCIPFEGVPSSPPSIEASINSDVNLNTGGVKVLNCDRDNIDVFSLVLQNNDERRYLVSWIQVVANICCSAKPC